MLTLAIDTSTKTCSTALCRDGQIIADYTINLGMTHSEGLLPQLEQLLKRTKTAKSDIELLAVSIGPGSFTGLRIGLATAETLAYSWGCCLHGVNTLKVLAYNLPVEGVVLAPVLDAQKGNYYCAMYQWRSGELEEISPVQIVNKEELLAKITACSVPVILLGECQKLEQSGLPAMVSAAHNSLRMPRASSVALLAEQEFDAQADQQIFGLEPYYIRRSEAEEQWEKRQQK